MAACVSGLAAAVVTGEPRQLVADYAISTTEARMALHLARAAVALGHPDRARAFVALGYALAGERADGLRAELARVLGGDGRRACTRSLTRGTRALRSESHEILSVYMNCERCASQRFHDR